jgi:ABC-type multidrug transport system permease subunit
VQPLIQALPLTLLIDSLRMVILDGASLVAVSSKMALLAAWGAVPFFTALRIFNWR